MASQPIYQFYAVLMGYNSKMWRRFQVAGNITMARLGYIIMTMYEMQASHLFCFDVSVEQNFRRRFSSHIPNEENLNLINIFEAKLKHSMLRIELSPEDDDFEFEGRVLDAAKTKLRNVLTKETEVMSFSYDYGDGWEVLLTLEKIFEDKELPSSKLPRVLDGEGNGIIEDCGGTGGLEEIEKAFKKKKGNAYKEYCDWLGIDDLDLATFDREDMNFRLKKVPRIYADIYEMGNDPTKRSMNILERKYLECK